ncbi:MAG: hypothetical protein GY855_15445 [candidate division Zixibacteria bacterium]|nr:hypothetical protein [candidate division Zixibacteria bacterium]
MGMALEESVEGMQKFDSNGISTYINPELYEQVSNTGDINIDYVEDSWGSKGFTIATGTKSGNCG